MAVGLAWRQPLNISRHERMFCSIKFGVIKPHPRNRQQNHFGGLKKAAKNWRQNMRRWWSSWTTDCFLLVFFLHDSCDGESPRHWTPTKPFWPRQIKASESQILFPAFITYPDLGFGFLRFHSERWCIRPKSTKCPRQLRGQRELRITELRRSLEEERQEATAQAAALYDPMWPSILIL